MGHWRSRSGISAHGGASLINMHRERFAPSPTGRLHLGHAYSALTVWDAAQAAGRQFLLRIEDIDASRARPEFEAAIYDDLRWLGLSWPEPVLRQSDNLAAYATALDRLTTGGLTYPCTCTRRDILSAMDDPQEGGPDGPIYPGTCRAGADPDKPQAIRLKMAEAIAMAGRLSFAEIGYGPDGETGQIPVDPDWLIQHAGDIVLARKDAPTSYHLSVVVDDAAQGITHVTRGEDLFSATPVHRLLQTLLGLPAPIYRHHGLIRDEAGRRLAKRADDKAISIFRDDGATPNDIRLMVGLQAR